MITNIIFTAIIYTIGVCGLICLKQFVAFDISNHFLYLENLNEYKKQGQQYTGQKTHY